MARSDWSLVNQAAPQQMIVKHIRFLPSSLVPTHPIDSVDIRVPPGSMLLFGGVHGVSRPLWPILFSYKTLAVVLTFPVEGCVGHKVLGEAAVCDNGARLVTSLVSA